MTKQDKAARARDKRIEAGLKAVELLGFTQRRCREAGTGEAVEVLLDASEKQLRAAVAAMLTMDAERMATLLVEPFEGLEPTATRPHRSDPRGECAMCGAPFLHPETAGLCSGCDDTVTA